MAAKQSAGILLYRTRDGRIEVLLAHPGGPFHAGRERGNWSIPKGEPACGEDLELAALREFDEETGTRPGGRRLPLGSIRQKAGKVVTAWAVEGDLDPASARSNEFEMEWPPGSGRIQSFPEVDRVAWFGLDEARDRLTPAQAELVDRLEEALTGADAARTGTHGR